MSSTPGAGTIRSIKKGSPKGGPFLFSARRYGFPQPCARRCAFSLLTLRGNRRGDSAVERPQQSHIDNPWLFQAAPSRRVKDSKARRVFCRSDLASRWAAKRPRAISGQNSESSSPPTGLKKPCQAAFCSRLSQPRQASANVRGTASRPLL